MGNLSHGSLFSGIGGFDLAAHWAGWTNLFQVEWNEYCQQILKRNFPDARIYGDIRQFDGKPWRGSVDVISGGFPCQPYSSAGKRLGKEDERHLWPEMLRVIREVAPRWVVGENVRGLVNWSGGLVFEEVCADLEASGYEVQPFILPAASVNAPHRRDRVWFIAYRSGEQMGASRQPREHGGLGCTIADAKSKHIGPGLRESEPERQRRGRSGNVGGQSVSANAAGIGLEEWAPENNTKDRKENSTRMDGSTQRPGLDLFTDWTTESPVCGMDDGIPRRMDRIAALGNAVVPQLVYRIFDTINQLETQ